MAIVSIGCSSSSVDPAPVANAVPAPGVAGETPKQTGTETATGLIVIDVQQSFIDTATRRNARSNVPARIASTKHMFDVASAHASRVFITYEGQKTGDGALPSLLANGLPTGTQEFIKTTFAATGQPQFAAAIQGSALRRFVVVGAETDVCVLQTILGLRRAGFAVAALLDGLFSEEVNVAPALRRMEQAGVARIGMTEAEALLAGGPAALPAPPANTPTIVEPLSIGIVLHGLDGMGAADTNAQAKRARLKELLTVTEWFRLPVFAADPNAASAALPADLRAILTRPIMPLSSRPPAIKQLALAGGNAGAVDAASKLRESGVDVFLIEDALVGGNRATLEPAYATGSIPTTYKTLYYELTHSISDAEWPSQQWVSDGDRYYDLTQAPEDLPPVTE